MTSRIHRAFSMPWRIWPLPLVCLLLVGGCGGGAGPSAPGGDPVAPAVLVDGGHHNGHRLTTTLAPLAAMLVERGWTVREHTGRFTPASLSDADVLVVFNAQDISNVEDWSNPVSAAFSAQEVAAVHAWVEGGGGLLLVADHMPFPAAAAPLAEAFGARFSNGFAFDPGVLEEPSPCLQPQEIHVFRRGDGTLADHPVTRGEEGEEGGARVDSVGTFTGQAFRIPHGAWPLLRFEAGAVSLLPDTAWVFHPDTPREDVSGWVQGALLDAGSGRVALFGEAAMFTTQSCNGDTPMGWNAPSAAQNRALALNVLLWLARPWP